MIAGAGLSGLTLALALAQADARRSILVVDPIAARVGAREGDGDFDRTIGFWTEGPPPFAELIERSWAQLVVDGPGGAQTIELAPYRYHYLRWSRLRDHLLAQLRARDSVQLLRGRVEAFIQGSQQVQASIGGRLHAAEFGFDSRLDPSEVTPAPGRVLGWQRFLAARIETPEPRFDPSRAWFMDFRPTQPDRVVFFNVLPDSPRVALVYRVELSPTRAGPELEPAFDRDLRELLGLERWRELGRERGALPLTDQRWARRIGARVLRIGIPGGRLKPSTGYAFTRILADNRAITASLAKHGHPFDLPRERARFRWLDGVLLERLFAAPARGPELFTAMFRRARPKSIFALLDERASLAQIVEIMAAMPHKLQLAYAGLRRTLAWLRAPRARALPTAVEQLALE